MTTTTTDTTLSIAALKVVLRAHDSAPGAAWLEYGEDPNPMIEARRAGLVKSDILAVTLTPEGERYVESLQKPSVFRECTCARLVNRLRQALAGCDFELRVNGLGHKATAHRYAVFHHDSDDGVRPTWGATMGDERNRVAVDILHALLEDKDI